MPLYLALLCWALVVLWLSDIAVLFAESVLLAEPEEVARYVIWGGNLIAAAITVLFLFVLGAFFRRARWSFVWLQTLTLVTALLVIGFAIFDDAPLRYSSTLEAIELARSWLEVFTCLALFFALKQTNTHRWFYGKDSNPVFKRDARKRAP